MRHHELLDFQKLCDDFNIIADKHDKVKLSDIEAQYKLIYEEVKEIKEKGIDQNNVEEVLDGTIDVLVTALGMLQKLQNMGIDTESALVSTANNNLSKYIPDDDNAESILNQSIEKYESAGEFITIHYSNDYKVYVLKNKNGKVCKPVGFIPNTLAAYIPQYLIQEGFQE